MVWVECHDGVCCTMQQWCQDWHQQSQPLHGKHCHPPHRMMCGRCWQGLWELVWRSLSVLQYMTCRVMTSSGISECCGNPGGCWWWCGSWQVWSACKLKNQILKTKFYTLSYIKIHFPASVLSNAHCLSRKGPVLKEIWTQSWCRIFFNYGLCLNFANSSKWLIS